MGVDVVAVGIDELPAAVQRESSWTSRIQRIGSTESIVMMLETYAAFS